MTRNPKPSTEAARKRMVAQGQRDTEPELAVRRLLHRQGLRYRVDFTVLKKPRRIADIAFIKAKVAVFVDGCFWHGCPEHGTWPKSNADFWRDKIEANRKRDSDTNRRLQANGWVVIRIWEHEDPQEAAERIAVVVRKRSSQ